MNIKDELVQKLNAADREERLGALRELALLHRSGAVESPETGVNVNNHIHTTFSFSPYSPTKAVYLAWASGLATAGIMDHDSVGGIEEFVEAGEIIGLPVTVGFECRCSLADTPFEGERLNNPDQLSVAYLAMHGIPHQMLGEAESFLAPYRSRRIDRNRVMVDKLNGKLKPYDIALNFSRDVLPLSQYASGGSVTERHILYALASKLTEKEMPRQFLLGQFKSQLIESIYVDATDELPHISEFIALSKRLGAIPAYAYLGDIGVSATGDKKSQAFEDAFLEPLLTYLKEIGIRAVTYMPTRNSPEQLERVMSLCRTLGFFQISGEDINSPLQSFICDKIESREFRHLIYSAWALIGHEAAASQELTDGMFSTKIEAEIPELSERIEHYALYAKYHEKYHSK